MRRRRSSYPEFIESAHRFLRILWTILIILIAIPFVIIAIGYLL